MSAIDPGISLKSAGATTPEREPRLAMLSLLASGAVWGLAWWPLQFFDAAGVSGHAIGLTAYSLVAAFSLPFIWRERHLWRPEWRYFLLIGLFFGCAQMSFNISLTMGSVVRAMLLFYLLPAWGAIGGSLFLGERLGRTRLAAVFLSLAGVFVIMGGSDILAHPLSPADFLALAAGLCYTAAGIVNRKARAIPMTSRTLVSFVGCSAVAILALSISVPSLPETSPSIWLLLLAFALVWLLGGTLLTTYGVTHVQASRAATLQVVELLVAVLSAIVLGGESLSLKDCLGGAMILSATLLEALTPADKK